MLTAEQMPVMLRIYTREENPVKGEQDEKSIPAVIMPGSGPDRSVFCKGKPF